MKTYCELLFIAWAKSRVGNGFKDEEYLSMTMSYICDKVSENILFIIMLSISGIIIINYFIESQVRRLLDYD